MRKLFAFAVSAVLAGMMLCAPSVASTDSHEMADDRQIVALDYDTYKSTLLVVATMEQAPHAEVRAERRQRDSRIRFETEVNPPSRRALASAGGWLHAPPG